MTVKEAIKQLRKMPQDAKLVQLWNSHLRSEANVIYLSKDGRVVLADFNEHCMNTEERPVDAPPWEEDSFWETRDKPEIGQSGV